MNKLIKQVSRGLKKVTLPVWVHLLGPIPPVRGGSADMSSGSGASGSGSADMSVIVSLTTIPSRIDKVWIVIESLLRQSVRPDRIVLTISVPEFIRNTQDNNNVSGSAQCGAQDGNAQELEIPESLLKYQAFGLQIVTVPEDIKSHNKYYYSLQAYPQACVITVDDDCYYHRHTIRNLMRVHEQYPSCVVGCITKVINMEHFYQYSAWKKVQSGNAGKSAAAPSHLNIAIGAGGILYPPGFAALCAQQERKLCAQQESNLFDISLIRQLAPLADDLWLKAHELVCGIKVAACTEGQLPITIPGSQKVALKKFNHDAARPAASNQAARSAASNQAADLAANQAAGGQNNKQWKALDEHFGLWTLLSHM